MELIGPLQLRIMKFIWAQGREITVHDVHKHLNAQPNVHQLAYTTVLTVMRNLVRRKILEQIPAGRKHFFKAAVLKTDYQEQLIKFICSDFFDGNATAMLQLVEAELRS